MIFLPIVGRELRVASRRRSTYSLRTGVAFGAILVGALIHLASTLALPVEAGQAQFWALAGLVMLYCLAAGRLATADSLSEEKRDGTLGLLFLTDLTGYDVVLGKLAATSITGFYGLLAVMPVLAVPLLVGGVTSAEFWRMVVVLVNTCLFSLAIGIFGSTVCRDRRSAMAVNLLLLLAFVAGLPSFGAARMYFSPLHLWDWSWLFACPIYSFALCSDALHAVRGGDFWISVGLVHGLTWLLVLLACQIAPVSWQDRPLRPASVTGRWLELWEACSLGPRDQRPAHRKRLLDINAFYWLAARARLKAHHVWIFLAFMAVWWLWVGNAAGGALAEEPVALTTALILNITFKIWITIEAGQRLAEDRKIGALELLLCTNLDVGDILRGQWLALRRQFFRPLLAIVALELLFMFLLWRRSYEAQIPVVWLTGLLILLADTAALGWVGMAAALTARSHNNATLTTLYRVLVLPWLALGLAALAGNLWAMLFSSTGWTPDWMFYLACWAGFGLAADVWFGLRAWRNLRDNFRALTLAQFSSDQPSRSRWFRRAVAAVEETAETSASPAKTAPARARSAKWKRAGLAGALGVVLFITFGVRTWWNKAHPKPPPPVVVAVSQNTALLRVYPGQMGFFFILPDGSLWRWGEPQGPNHPRTVTPERVGTNSNWAAIALSYNRSLGLSSNGTLWDLANYTGAPLPPPFHAVNSNGTPQDLFNSPSAYSGSEPGQTRSDQDWVMIASGNNFSVARKHDGTLWAWGGNSRNELGNGPGPNTGVPRMVGTNHNWINVTTYGAATLALRTDGTLWIWGEARFLAAPATRTNFALPTRLGSDSNWVALSHDNTFLPLVQNQAGELWYPLIRLPAPDESLTAGASPLATNVLSDHLAFGNRYVGLASRVVSYEVRSNGTLWSTPLLLGPNFSRFIYPEPWRRFGGRSDWLAVWSNSGTALGLTADGTVWMWGLDLGREPVLDFQARLAQLKSRLSSVLGSSRTAAAARPGPVSPLQTEPRPIMLLVPTNQAGAR